MGIAIKDIGPLLRFIVHDNNLNIRHLISFCFIDNDDAAALRFIFFILITNNLFKLDGLNGYFLLTVIFSFASTASTTSANKQKRIGSLCLSSDSTLTSCGNTGVNVRGIGGADRKQFSSKVLSITGQYVSMV
ncbi:unnamed protein product [Adineta steineri]|uniref:Uncharacterized protein n=1 Tax=Adineta steineri TaxID=433720 RepID=A0A814D377_9BILA|nr:unnamed protein product [Adineta steineri]